MGRLTLNVLLSFAQFEREVTGERIRDKIAASKRKGMWMGGFVPLGYDLCDRRIVIDEREAETVRYIYRRYQELGCGLIAQRRSGPPRCRFQAANLKDRNRVWRALVLPRGTLRAPLESGLRR